jgi:hypothetical protein
MFGMNKKLLKLCNLLIFVEIVEKALGLLSLIHYTRCILHIYSSTVENLEI